LASATHVAEIADVRLTLARLIARLEIGIHIQKRIARLDDDGVGVEDPCEAVEDGGEGISDGDVVMNEEAVLVAAAFGDAPAHDLGRSGEDFGLTSGVLPVSLSAGDAITEAASIDDGEKAITQFALHSLCEFNGDDASGKGFVEHGPQSFADAGGADDDVLRYPQFGKGLYFAEDGDVILTRPLLEVYGAVGGGLEDPQGGEIYLYDAEGD